MDKAAGDAVWWDMSQDSFLHIQNLTIPDPYFILPLILSLSTLTVVEITSRLRPDASQRSLRHKTLTWILRGVTVCVALPIAMFMPSAITLFWVTTSVSSLAFNIALSYPQVRKKFGIKGTHLNEKTFTDVVNEIKGQVQGNQLVNRYLTELKTKFKK